MLNQISNNQSPNQNSQIPGLGNLKKGKTASGQDEVNFAAMINPGMNPQNPASVPIPASLVPADKVVPQQDNLAGNPDSLKKETTKNSLGITPMSEIAPSSLKVATSSNTAAEIAGPKPWGAQWVFTGREAPDLKPLINSNNTPNIQAELLKLMGSEAEIAPTAQPKSAPPLQAAGSGKNMKDVKEVAPNSLMKMQNDLGFEVLGVTSDEMPIAQEMPLSQRMNLSGAEYLDTLGAIKSKDNQKSNLGQQSDGDSSGFKMNQPEVKTDPRSLKPRIQTNTTNFGEILAAPSLPSAQIGQVRQAAPAIPAEVSGYVIPGAMARNRLSSESLLGISNGLKTISQQGGGEMRIRLKPDSLGELQLKVKARGNEVSLQIRASDAESKKVLEESIKYLKDSMASQRLNLSKVEFVVAQPAAQQSGLSMDSGNSNANSQNYLAAQDFSGQNSSNYQNRGFENQDGSAQPYADERRGQESGLGLERSINSLRGSRTGSYRESGKLDVLA
jgi:flagellar hook-length control protein FliK